MPISYKKTVAVLEGECAIEEAETLLAWLLDHPGAKVNLKQLTHMHTALLQVLLALQTEVSVFPDDPSLNQYLHALWHKEET